MPHYSYEKLHLHNANELYSLVLVILGNFQGSAYLSENNSISSVGVGDTGETGERHKFHDVIKIT